ncbi:MAG TPA: DUF488 domain-containing protein [Myxococcales bacterium]|jgi:uncharacterized protein (DUF488 family)
MPRRPPELFAIGHSTRALEELVEVLRLHEIATVADIRTVPRSLRNPQFNRESLPGALGRASIGYVHLPRLGGLRHLQKGDHPASAGWRNPSFRAFAEYMQTAEFEDSLRELLALDGPVAFMCAEALPWRCHRSLVADALVARGLEVEQIIGRRAVPHGLTPFARVVRKRVLYPAAEAPQGAGS